MSEVRQGELEVEVLFLLHAECEWEAQLRETCGAVRGLLQLTALPSLEQLSAGWQLLKSGGANQDLSLLGRRQLLDLQAMLHVRRFFQQPLVDCCVYSPQQGAMATVAALSTVGQEKKIPLASLAELNVLENALFHRVARCRRGVEEFEHWLRGCGAKQVLAVGYPGMFDKLTQARVRTRNCDIWKSTVKFVVEQGEGIFDGTSDEQSGGNRQATTGGGSNGNGNGSNSNTTSSSGAARGREKRMKWTAPQLLHRSALAEVRPLELLWGHADQDMRPTVIEGLPGDNSHSTGASGGDDDDTRSNGDLDDNRLPPNTCRFCLETTESAPRMGMLIRPCRCEGSIAYVHRSCLDHWRATSHEAYTRCNVCKFEYVQQQSSIAYIFTSPAAIGVLTCLLLVAYMWLLGAATIAALLQIRKWYCINGWKNSLNSYVRYGVELMLRSLGKNTCDAMVLGRHEAMGQPHAQELHPVLGDWIPWLLPRSGLPSSWREACRIPTNWSRHAIGGPRHGSTVLGVSGVLHSVYAATRHLGVGPALLRVFAMLQEWTLYQHLLCSLPGGIETVELLWNGALATLFQLCIYLVYRTITRAAPIHPLMYMGSVVQMVSLSINNNQSVAVRFLVGLCIAYIGRELFMEVAHRGRRWTQHLSQVVDLRDANVDAAGVAAAPSGT